MAKQDIMKVPGKSTLNQKASIFADKRTKRKKTRKAKNDQAIKDSQITEK
jgi:hypothetical protein